MAENNQLYGLLFFSSPYNALKCLPQLLVLVLEKLVFWLISTFLHVQKIFYCHKKAFLGGSIGKALILLFRRLAASSPTRGGRLIADARDQQPFEPGEWGLESCSLRSFLREPPCRTCKKHQASI